MVLAVSEPVLKTCPKSNKTFPKPFPGRPPLPPTLPEITGMAPVGRPKPPTLSILGRLFAVRKLIKNQTLQKPSQNLKSRTPDRPKVDFVLTFGINFGMDFHEILDFFIIC